MGRIRAAFKKSKTCSQRQLLVDVSILHQNDAGTGIQRVVRALCEQLRQCDTGSYNLRLVAASRRGCYRYLEGGYGKDARRRKVVRARQGDIFLGLDLSSRILPANRRQLQRWKTSGAHICVFLYDLLPVKHPEWFGDPQVAAFQDWLNCIALLSDQVICISNAVAEEFAMWLRHYQLDYKNIEIDTIKLGGDLKTSKPSSGISLNEIAALQHLEKLDFVLVVGTIEPRKGHVFALDAFDVLFKQGGASSPALVVVGRPGWKTENLQQRMQNHAELGARFFWFDNASDELLERLYSVCRGLLFPTLGEGFGLPVSEALTHKKPVLVRNLAVFAEFESPLLTYFDDDTPENLADRIVEWLDLCGNEKFSSSSDSLTWQTSCKALLAKLKIYPSSSLRTL